MLIPLNNLHFVLLLNPYFKNNLFYYGHKLFVGVTVGVTDLVGGGGNPDLVGVTLIVGVGVFVGVCVKVGLGVDVIVGVTVGVGETLIIV